MNDQFRNISELLKACGKDSVRIEKQEPDSDFAIIAPHGGSIEPDTEIVAKHIAGGDLKYYAFIGKLRKEQANQHITSTRFDEADGDRIVKSVRVVVAIHGRRRGRTDADEIFVGGANQALRAEIAKALNGANFKTAIPPKNLAGEETANICNRCTDGGVQLELTRALRQQLTSDVKMMQRFSHAVRQAIGAPV